MGAAGTMGLGCRLLARVLALLSLLPPVSGSCLEEGSRLRGCDRPGKTRTPMAQEMAKGLSGSQERSREESSVGSESFWSSGGPSPHHQVTCVGVEADGAFCELVQCACPAGPCSVKVEVPSCAAGPPCSEEDVTPKLLPRTDVMSATVSAGAPIKAVVCVWRSTPTSQPATLPTSFRVQMAPTAALCLVMDFGDGSGVQTSVHHASGEVAVTAYHRYNKEGVHALTAVIHKSHGAIGQLGPYYVQTSREATSVFMNSSSVHGDQVLAFGGSPTDLRSIVVTHRFSPSSSYSVSFAAQTCMGGRPAWSSMTVQYQMQPVSVHTNGTVFATDTDITFVAVTKETTPLEFTWFLGEAPPVRTTSRSIRKRLGTPQWYRVVVQVSNGIGRVASEPHLIQVQRRVVANRLTSASSALVNATVTFECRINFGTNVSYLWDFGDGAGGLGDSSASHAYSREGAFVVKVLAFNAVSTASLRKHVFIVRQPCQPPPVRSAGPGKVQVWRSQPVTLGVTFEAAVLCDISQGLSYTWSFTNSAGSRVPLPLAVSTHRQTVTVPSYVLEPGNYTALAKVQVEGSAVHSNYSVELEVRARAPVSVIAEGTHLFVPRTPSSTVVLSGSLSYDPDRPGAALRYHWTCTPASTPGHPCFPGPSAHSLDAGMPSLSFPADSLSRSYDQFLVTLMVSSHGQNSSKAQVFLSTLPDSTRRLVHVSWVTFRGIPVNWNEALSLRAVCRDCGEAAALSYSWHLFLVNATARDREEVPFCRTVGLLGSLGLGADLKLPESYPRFLGPTRAEPHVTPVPSSRELRPWAPGRPDRTAMGKASQESMVTTHHVPVTGDTAAPDGDPWSEGPPGRPTPQHPDFEAYYSDIQEAVPSGRRQPNDGTSVHLPELGPGAGADESRGDGDNLVGPFLPTTGARPVLLVDWPKAPVSQAVFRGYTASGTTGQTVTVKPYSLSPGATYVLQATVASGHSFLGRAQLYLTVNQAPRDVACQVQPHRGLEAHTTFSVFCTSGRPDLHYEFGYRTGNASGRTLYRGRDAQYYFTLPAGEPWDDYQVLVFTAITDGKGSQAQPCAVTVTVLPRVHGDRCPGEDVYNSSLKTLSTLQQMGSYRELRNYISMATRVLSRWAEEDGSPWCGQWSRIQDALISSVCGLASQDQEEVLDSVLLLQDLLHLPNKLGFWSARLILKFARSLLAPRPPSEDFVADEGRVRELALLVSGVLEVTDRDPSRWLGQLHEDGVQIISDALLGCLSLGGEHQLHIHAGPMELQAQLHRDPQSSVQSLGPVHVHLPADLAGQEARSPCYVSQLLLFKGGSSLWGRTPGQVGTVLSALLYSCSSRRPLRRQWLRTPVTVEFGEEDDPGKGGDETFVLLRDRVNVHHFVGLSETPQESLQIRVEFSQPVARAFPVTLLVRFSQKPTPSDFLVKQTHFWEGLTAHISVPAASLKGHTMGYLSLLDADYDREPPNRHLARALNYSVRFQGTHCRLWDRGQWKSKSFSPQPGASPGKVNCSYDCLATFSVARRNLNASLETSDISEFRGHPENLLPSTVIVVFTLLYALLLTKSKQMDRHEKRKTGYIFPQEDPLPDHQLYAVVVDTGFRAPARFTAKVYIVLCGENGLSEPKELYCPEKPLFERNSRHTFILSALAPLGPLRKIRLWHDGHGASPAWYISHVMVKELRGGQGHWFFPAECWLAAGRWDGRVERELACLRRGLGFLKLLYCKFTEYLEDFHVWASVHSRPSGRGLLHTPRLGVAFTLLCAYACLAAAVTTTVTAAAHAQLPLAVGPAGIPPGLFRTGLLCTLLASPGAQLLSLLFRLSQNAPNVLSGSVQAQSTANSDGTGPHLREKTGNCVLSLEAPCRVFDGLATSRWLRVPQPWLGSAAWATCGMVSMACGVGTGFLGYRFSPAQCGQWLCLLTVSVTCCVFITQPLMVGLVALGFAWRRRDDESFFTESLWEATEDLDTDLGVLSVSHMPHTPSCCNPHGAGATERAVARRQRARRLRWARPPSTTRLRVTRERMRRQRRTWVVLRDSGMYGLMLLLHLLITHGTSCWDEHSLNHAIRDAFTRSARSSSGGLSSLDAWWDWSLTTLLDALYQHSSPAIGTPGAQPGALGGKCYLLGPPSVRLLRVPPGSSCELPKPLVALTNDSLPVCHPKVGGPQTSSVTDAEIQGGALSGPKACREDCELSLGRTRLAAHAALTSLRARRWVSPSTRAVSVHFVLYNPPTCLFSIVSLRAEVLPAGGLSLSPLVESVTIFHRDSAPRYHLMLPQGHILSPGPHHYELIDLKHFLGGPMCRTSMPRVGLPRVGRGRAGSRGDTDLQHRSWWSDGGTGAVVCFSSRTSLAYLCLALLVWRLAFLVLTLTHLCLQLYGLAEKGVRRYWSKPGNWLELSMAGVGLAWYAASGHLLSLAGEVTDQFHKGFLQGFGDLRHMASWNQRARWLQGTLSFLLTLKCIHLLGSQSTTASCFRVMRRSLSGVFAPGLMGALVLAACAHLRGIPLFALAPPPGTSADAFHWLPLSFPGSSRRDAFLGLSSSGLRAPAGCCMAVLTAVAVLWFGMLRGSLMAFTPKIKSLQSQPLVRLGDVAACTWRRACSVLGLEMQTRQGPETELAESQNYYLAEFADLLDELLLKVEGLSGCLQPPCPGPQSWDAVEARAAGAPLVGASDD